MHKNLFQIMCAIVVIVWCLILISPWENFQEISVDKYRWLKSDCRNYPEVKPLVRKFYKDGKITKYEFNKVRDVVHQLYNVEDARIYDSIKINLDSILF